MIKTEFKDHECGKLRLDDIDKTVTLSGWVATVRDLGGIGVVVADFLLRKLDNPELAEKGLNRLSLDSGRPTENYRDFLMGEVRYNSLKLKFPEEAEALFTKAEQTAKDRYDELVMKSKEQAGGSL